MIELERLPLEEIELVREILRVPDLREVHVEQLGARPRLFNACFEKCYLTNG